MRGAGVRSCQRRSAVPSSPNRSFPGIVQRSRPVAETARPYGPGPCGPWAVGRGTAHRAPRAGDGEFLEHRGRRRPRRLKTEPPRGPGRGPDGSRAPRRKRRPSPAPGAPGEHHGRIHPQRRRQPPPSGPVPRRDGSIPDPAVTPGTTGPPAQRQPEEDRTPAATGARFFDESEQTCGHRPHPRAGPVTGSGPGRQSVLKIMTTNDMAPLSAQGEDPSPRPRAADLPGRPGQTPAGIMLPTRLR